jgi:hypothetical protein
MYRRYFHNLCAYIVDRYAYVCVCGDAYETHKERFIVDKIDVHYTYQWSILLYGLEKSERGSKVPLPLLKGRALELGSEKHGRAGSL